MDKEWYDKITEKIIGAAIEVHRELGPGLIESVYEICMVKELKDMGLKVESQVLLPVVYKGVPVGKNFVIDLLVENEVVVELKCVEDIFKVHEVQLLTYIKLAKKKLGLLINFNEAIVKQGIRRRINGVL